MNQLQLLDPRIEAAGLIRNEPVQARSAARLAALLDAAAQVIDEIGYERLTTAMVADRAGASIGTVYRYFPDRIAVLQSLAARNAERVIERVIAEVNEARHDNWEAALNAAFQVYVDAFRSEPGFASLRLGDVLDLRPATTEPMNSLFARRLYQTAAERFGLPESEEALVAFEAVIEVCDALTTRAFARDPEGSRLFLDQVRIATSALMVGHLPSS